MSDVTVVVDWAAIEDLANADFMPDLLMPRGRLVARDAQRMAPVRATRSQGGAASIHAELVKEFSGWTVRVGWDAQHAYMRFTDRGTRHIPAQRYLERALEREG